MADKKKTTTPIQRYRENPYIGEMIIPVKTQRVRVSPLGKDRHVIIDQESGEERGTHLVTYKKVDAEQYVKIFTQNIGLSFGLTAAGIKALSVLIWEVQKNGMNKDVATLDDLVRENFLEAHKGLTVAIRLSRETFSRGLSDLVKAQILARHVRKGSFFINPNFIFNGNRIAFTTIIEREKAENGSNDKSSSAQQQIDHSSASDPQIDPDEQPSEPSQTA